MKRIEFFNEDPSVIETFPIIESKDLKLKWVRAAKQDFQNCVKGGDTNDPNFKHVVHCPGIFDLFKHGYIIPVSKDIIVKPAGEGLDWAVAGKPLNSFSVACDTGDLISKPPWVADLILKINTGWHVIAPKGVKFLLIPIAYPDTFDFTSTIGIFDPPVDTCINFQLFLNDPESEILIPAGTPLGHLIPLSEKKYQMVQRGMNQRDKDWLRNLDGIFSSTFWSHTIRRKIIDMYNKHWKQ